MSTKITPKALIEMGFEKSGRFYKLEIRNVVIEVDLWKNVWVYDRVTNATTIEDIKDLIRLFK